MEKQTHDQDRCLLKKTDGNFENERLYVVRMLLRGQSRIEPCIFTRAYTCLGNRDDKKYWLNER